MAHNCIILLLALIRMKSVLMIWLFLMTSQIFGQNIDPDIDEHSIFGTELDKISFDNADSLFEKISYKKPMKNKRHIRWRNGGVSWQKISRHYIKYKKNKLKLIFTDTDGSISVKIILLKKGTDLTINNIFLGKTKPKELKGIDQKYAVDSFQYFLYADILFGVKLKKGKEWTGQPIVIVKINNYNHQSSRRP